MKTTTNCWRFAPVLLLLCLSLGCTQEALNLKEFRKANGRTVVVDKTYKIPREDVVGATILLQAGVYHLEFKEDSPENIWFNSVQSTKHSLVLNYTEYKKVLDNNVLRDATPDVIAQAERQKEEEGNEHTSRSGYGKYMDHCNTDADCIAGLECKQYSNSEFLCTHGEQTIRYFRTPNGKIIPVNGGDGFLVGDLIRHR